MIAIVNLWFSIDSSVIWCIILKNSRDTDLMKNRVSVLKLEYLNLTQRPSHSYLSCPIPVHVSAQCAKIGMKVLEPLSTSTHSYLSHSSPIPVRVSTHCAKIWITVPESPSAPHSLLLVLFRLSWTVTGKVEMDVRGKWWWKEGRDCLLKWGSCGV